MLIGFDLDGTLIRSYMGDDGEKVQDFTQVDVIPGRRDKILDIADEYHSFFIATNQGGVAHGFQTQHDVETKIGRVLTEFQFFHGRPFSIHVAYFDPRAPNPRWHGSNEEQRRRKPNGGMLIEAMLAHGAGRKETIYVGDMESDAKAARDARVKFVLAEDFFR